MLGFVCFRVCRDLGTSLLPKTCLSLSRTNQIIYATQIATGREEKR